MNSSSYIPIEDIYRETNCGLDIFLHYFPDSKNCLIKKNSKFKIRDEKTASANLYQDKNIWFLKDHGIV